MARREISNKRNGYGKTLTSLAAVAVLLIVVVGLVFLWPQPHQKVTVTIKPGSSSGEIASVMAGQGVVRNAFLFKLFIGRQNAQNKLQAGDYALETGMSFAEALAALLKGPAVRLYKVTTPEGLTIEQTAETVAANSPIKKDDLLAANDKSKYKFDFLDDVPENDLEGYLFPKTYTVRQTTTAEDLIRTMLKQFEEETAILDMSLAEKRGMKLFQIVTIASIIEKEVKIPEERPLVAAVIYNRLDKDMYLQICATVEYALPEHKESLSYQDLEYDSPYNTYKYPGLPPGPICSPGMASMEAALKPAPVDYLYYVLTGENGSHTFTNNYEEFAKIKEEKGL
ncbi:MAG: endolytic transglycosylase MltG [Actinomycetota bacterium]